MVQTKKKPERPDKNSQHVAQWFFCALSKKPLRVPVVACAHGRLYNKDAIYEYLLDPTSHGDGDLICKHVRKPRVCFIEAELCLTNLTHTFTYTTPHHTTHQHTQDVVTLKLTENTAFNRSAKIVEGEYQSEFMCPISMKEMNGHARFCFLWSCGCVVSEQAMKEVPEKMCLKVGLWLALGVS